MNIGLFTDTYLPQVSGVATSIKTLKDELEQQGHNVTIFTTTDPNADKNEENIIRLASIPFFSFKDRRIAISGSHSAVKKAKELNLDLIHTQTEFSLGLTGKQVANHLKIPCIHTYHTMYEDYLHYIAKGKIVKPYHVKILARYFCNQTNGLIAPSERVLKQLRDYDVVRPIEIIPTGVVLEDFNLTTKVNIRQELGISTDTPVLLSLSRLSQEKNITALLLAMPELLQAKPNLQLVIVGKGPQCAELKALATRLDITDHVIFVGEKKRQEVPAYYAMADLFVSASESESQGLTYIESLACGTNIIAKQNEYTESLIGNGNFGKLFVQDEDLASTILAELDKPKDLADLEKKRTQLLYDISSEAFGKHVFEFYQTVIAEYQYKAPRGLKIVKFYR
ncbi:glycosyltransferase family 4 protein [Carnobacterium maltaromaticum]|uniref:Glycosyltransferase family 4 protein n=1 Tax=Carnobacterium maltaromaticum TaxID=2751 RepID=A0AAW9K0Y7_CARML|nr:glycosyltransferase family 4 protein [Carnobacterium maltaromaticum]MDZ5758536.1 glycosyltransferase family 4 protein [Carnobacterium maltaromaticum]